MTALTLFDYATVSDPLRRELVEDAAYIRGHQERVNEGVIAVGERLLIVKAKLPHGQFLRWVEAECGYSERSANDYMNIAKEFSQNPHRGADLSMRAQRLLAAPSTPQAVKDIAYQRLDEGKAVTAAEIERLKRELADKDAEVKRAAREAEQAKRQADAEKAKSADLLGQVNVLKENADAVRIKARQEAEAKMAAERERLAAELAEARAESERVRQEVGDAAKAQAEAAAQAAIAEVEGDVRAARQKEAEAKRAVERLREQQQFLDRKVKEHQDYLSKIKGAEVEAKEILDTLEDLTTALVSSQLVFMDIDFEHDDHVMKKVRISAEQCRKMAEMLEAACAPRLVYDADEMREKV